MRVCRVGLSARIKKHWTKSTFLYHVDFLVFSASSAGDHPRILCLTLSVWQGYNKADMNLYEQIKF